MKKSPKMPKSKSVKSRKVSGTKFSPRIILKQKKTEIEDEHEEPKMKAKLPAVMKAFSQVWLDLFTTPVHLDSVLSKQSVSLKSILAQIIPTILLRPASQAEALGVGIPQNEPWILDEKKRSQWRPAQLMAERLYEMMVQPRHDIQPINEDFPEAMISEWRKAWSDSVVSELVNILGKDAPLGLRASRRVGSQALLTRLTEERRLPVRCEISQIAPLGVRLSGYAPVLGTKLFKEGAFEIQDEGSQFMALFALWPERYGSILQAKPGAVKILDLPPPPLPKDTPAWTIVDACAGAGGKSLALADALKGKGRIYSYDVSEKKLQALRRRATHAQLNNIQAVCVKEGSETDAIGRFKGTAQVVLVDAPCSGWGVLRRNPDIKWRQKPDVLERMPQIQLRLLTQYSSLVAPGGRLVYGVCTFRLAETREVIKKFLSENSQFTAQEGGFLGPGPCDGFFMQSLVRTK